MKNKLSPYLKVLLMCILWIPAFAGMTYSQLQPYQQSATAKYVQTSRDTVVCPYISGAKVTAVVTNESESGNLIVYLSKKDSTVLDSNSYVLVGPKKRLRFSFYGKRIYRNASSDSVFSQVIFGDDVELGSRRPPGIEEEDTLPPSLPITNLLWDFNFESLADGSVSLWQNQLDTFSLRQSTAGSRPVKSATNINFDGSDALYSNSTLNTGSGAVTIHMVVKVVDTAHTSPPLSHQYFHFKNSTKIIEWIIFNNSFGATRLQMLLYNGTNWNNTKYFSVSNIRLNEYALYTITYNGVNAINLYVNGVLASGTATSSGGFSEEGFKFGNFGGVERYVPSGTGVKRILVYNEENTQETINLVKAFLNNLLG